MIQFHTEYFNTNVLSRDLTFSNFCTFASLLSWLPRNVTNWMRKKTAIFPDSLIRKLMPMVNLLSTNFNEIKFLLLVGAGHTLSSFTILRGRMPPNFCSCFALFTYFALGSKSFKFERFAEYLIFSRILPFGRRPNGKIVCTVLCTCTKSTNEGWPTTGKSGSVEY